MKLQEWHTEKGFMSREISSRFSNKEGIYRAFATAEYDNGDGIDQYVIAQAEGKSLLSALTNLEAIFEELWEAWEIQVFRDSLEEYGRQLIEGG